MGYKKSRRIQTSRLNSCKFNASGNKQNPEKTNFETRKQKQCKFVKKKHFETMNVF